MKKLYITIRDYLWKEWRFIPISLYFWLIMFVSLTSYGIVMDGFS